MTAPARLRLDKSRAYSTIHGERTPGDPHQLAFYCQEGIHFDAQGLHIEHLLDEKTLALVEKRLKRQAKAAPKDDADEPEEGDGEPASDKDSGAGEVNLELWLRGEAKYPWFAITKTVRDRYHQNISKQSDMVAFLVLDEKVVEVDQLDPQLAALLPK